MAAGFMGFDLKTVDDMGYNGKVGVNYQVNKMVSIGAQYTSATKFTYDGGKIAVKGLGSTTRRSGASAGRASTAWAWASSRSTT